ncbi:hypothetical protein GGI21_005017, partial [Coemansia aciculifera]
MQEWLTGRYFTEDLQVCCEGGSSFEPLGTMITRVGGSQSVFVYSALAFLSQGHPLLSGISTPATPNAMSRATSAVQLRMPGGDISRPVTATPTARGSGYQQIGPGPAIGFPAATSVASSATAQPNAFSQPTAASLPAGQDAATSATHIATLLNDQLFIVSAIGEHQYVIGKLQEQHQQNLAKLMQELSQEINAVHYQAQLERAPVQNELLVTLQMRAQAAEERLRHEHMLLIQNQATEIGRLEANIDPIIKDMIVRSGTEFAISFINKQLQDLSLMAAAESAAPQASAAVASAGDSLIANEAAAVRKDLAVSAASVFASEVDTDVVGQDNKSLAAHSDVAALTETLEHVDLAASDSQVPSPTAASVKGDAAKAASAKESTVGTKGGKSRSQSKASETSSAKPASAWGATKSASKDASELAATANATVASASTRATGSNTVVA